MRPPPEEPKPSMERTRLSNIRVVDTLEATYDPALGVSILEPPRAAGEIGWFQHYRVLRQLGHGGMGVVYLAEDVHLRRLVALKVMHQYLVSDPVARRRFLREARAMAAIQHEHVATIFHVGTGSSHDKKEVPFIAMQYLEGETLQDRLVRQPPFAMAEVLRIGREIAEGLDAAHAKGMIHRDIKPTNIWLVGSNGSVKILDFGLAHLLESASNVNSSGQIVGTLHFMSPEQALGENVDARSDLFSLGCVLYAMLSRRLPFDGPTPSAVLTKLIDEEPAPLLDCVPNLLPDLARLVHHLLAKSPSDRPENAASVQADLAKIELQCGKLADPSSASGAPVNLAHIELPAATLDTVDKLSWTLTPSSLRD